MRRLPSDSSSRASCREFRIPAGQSFCQLTWRRSDAAGCELSIFEQKGICQLLLVLGGHLLLDNQVHSAGEGRLLPPPGKKPAVHQVAATDGCEWIHLVVPARAIEFLPPGTGRERLSISPPALFQLALLLAVLEDQPLLHHLLPADLARLLQLLAAGDPAAGGERFSFNECLAFARSFYHLPDPLSSKCTLAHWASCGSLKSYRLPVLCRELLGLTAREVLQFLKMQSAARAIGEKQNTLHCISRELDYSNDENLITGFRKYFGITPHVYQNLMGHSLQTSIYKL